MNDPITLHTRFKAANACVLIPTYNNDASLEQVISDVAVFTHDIIVVNDGSTDNTASILAGFPFLQVLNHEVNRGKGLALRDGFAFAVSKGYQYAISIDSD